MEVIDHLLWRTRMYSLSHHRQSSGRPSAGLVIIACMDARLGVESLFGLRPGEAHVLRNAGGTVTDDVVRGLIVSQQELGTDQVLLIHHTDCAMTRLDEPALRARIRAEAGTEPPFPLLGFADVEIDVRESMATLRACPFLAARDHIRGFVFDVADGRLHEVDPAPSATAQRPG